MSSKDENRDHPVVLAISGLDPTGSAGLLADVRIISSLGCHPVGVVTCETVQSSNGVTDIIPTEVKLLREQLKTIVEDLRPDAIKIGALASEQTILAISKFLDTIPDIPVVLDPVVGPTTGVSFLSTETGRLLVEFILNKAYIATPNAYELGVLSDRVIFPSDDDSVSDGISSLLESGVRHLLVTGLNRDGEVLDRLARFHVDGFLDTYDFPHPYIESGEVHGTGCVLSSAIASSLALSVEVNKSIEMAIELTLSKIKSAVRLGQGAKFWI